MLKLIWFAVCLTGFSLTYSERGHNFITQSSVNTTTTQEVPLLSVEEILEALTYGFNEAKKLLSGKTSKAQVSGQQRKGFIRNKRKSDGADDASSLQFDFHAPDQVALENSCVGMGLVKATQFLTEKHFEGMDGDHLIEIWKKLKGNLNHIDSEMCYKLTEKICGVKHLNQSLLECSPQYPYRSYNGSCNNLENPLWGTVATPFVRFLEPDYGDGVQSLRGSRYLSNSSLPSPRKVSAKLQNTTARPEIKNVNMMIMEWGQLLSHDVSLAPEAAMKINGMMKPLKCCEDGAYSASDEKGECQPIDTSEDSFYQAHGKDCIRFVRSIPGNKGCIFGAREQVNQQTAFVDASMIYGPTESIALNCRSKEGGKLKISYMGGDKYDYLAKKSKCKKMFPTCYLSGDGRVDETAGLTSLHTLFHRLHNVIAKRLADINPHWKDERLYQEGRHIVAALMQQINFKEYLPLIIGPKIMKMYKLEVLDDGYTYNYNGGCNPSIANAFPTAAFRFGHSMIKETFRNGNKDLPLQGNFFNVSNFLTGKTCPSRILAGLAEDTLAGNDVIMANVVFEHLFAPHGAPTGLDLMALNIQRGRDHGLPGYIEWRRVCKLSAPTDFNELSSIMNEDYAQAFKAVYKDVKDIDLFPAGLAEYPLDGALVGPTFACIIGQQFQNTKMGDRFWYENGDQPKPFTPDQLRALRKVSLSTIICGCSGIIQLQPQVFSSFHLKGNNLKLCNTYEELDLTPWKDEMSSST